MKQYEAMLKILRRVVKKMAEFKGSILELNNKKAVVMTDKCDFITIKRTPEMYLGQQLTFKESSVAKSYKINGFVGKVTAIAAVFVLALFSVLYFQVIYPSNVYAYIDVDINPSMEFTVNKASKVVEVKALNSDAQKLLKELHLKKIPVRTAITEVIESSKKMGFISTEKNNKVLVSVALKKIDRTPSSEEEKALTNLLSDIEKINVNVGDQTLQPKVLQVNPEERKAAEKNNISMGRYKLYEDIKKTDASLTIDKAKKERVADMLDKAETKNKNKLDKKTKSRDKSGKANQGNSSPNNKNTQNKKTYDTNVVEENNNNVKEHYKNSDNNTGKKSTEKKNTDNRNKEKDVFNGKKPDKASEKDFSSVRPKNVQPPKTYKNKPNNSK